MKYLIVNNTNELKYYDIRSRILLPAADALFPKRINASDLDLCLKNGLFTFRRTTESYLPVAGVIPIPSRTTWSLSDGEANYERSLGIKRLNKLSSTERIDRLARRYTNFIEGEKVAIELSGGLDTALIIEIVKRQGIKLSYVGFTSDRYEFRTERAIQNYYLENSDDNNMIDYAECPAFASLTNTPLHPFPTADSLYHARHSKIIEATKSLGAKILLNGNAGDSLLCHGFEHVTSWVPKGYDQWSLTDTWTVDTMFAPRGVSYLCPFAFEPVIRNMIGMRKGFPEDSMKLWARKTFSNILPYQLSKFAYKANHDCWVADGLRDAISDINTVVNTAFEITKHPELNSKSMIKTAANYFHAPEKEKHQFLLKLSFAVWLYGFVRENLI